MPSRGPLLCAMLLALALAPWLVAAPRAASTLAVATRSRSAPSARGVSAPPETLGNSASALFASPPSTACCGAAAPAVPQRVLPGTGARGGAGVAARRGALAATGVSKSASGEALAWQQPAAPRHARVAWAASALLAALVAGPALPPASPPQPRRHGLGLLWLLAPLAALPGCAAQAGWFGSPPCPYWLNQGVTGGALIETVSGSGSWAASNCFDACRANLACHAWWKNGPCSLYDSTFTGIGSGSGIAGTARGALCQSPSPSPTASFCPAPPGAYCASGAVLPCPAGAPCAGGNATPAPCTAGTASAATGATSSATCAQCPPGAFSGAGAAACSLCPAGVYGSAAGLTTSACSGNCSAPPGAGCAAGSTSPANATQCLPGTFCPGGSPAPALPCAPATACPEAGMSAQPPCYWNVSSLAGDGTAGFSGGGRLKQTLGASASPQGDIFFADSGNAVIRAFTHGSGTRVVAGIGELPGFADGGATAATFRSPAGVLAASASLLFVADMGNHKIRKINLAGNVVSTFAGGGASGDQLWCANGVGTSALFNYPYGIALTSTGALVVADKTTTLFA